MRTRVCKWLSHRWLVPVQPSTVLSPSNLAVNKRHRLLLVHVHDAWSVCPLCSSLGTHSSVTSRPPVRLARRVRDGPPLCSRAECCPTHQTWRRKWWRTTWQCTRSLEPTRYPAVTHTHTHTRTSVCMKQAYVIYKLKDWSHTSRGRPFES